MSELHVYRRSHCRLCESPFLELVVPLEPTAVSEKYVTSEELKEELADRTPKYSLDLYMCCDCGHVQLVDIVDPKFLFQDYTYKSANTKGILNHFEEVVSDLFQRYFNVIPRTEGPRDLFVVDIGSNDGSLLSCFKRRGCQVLGIDPAREIADLATQKGIETWPEFMTQNVSHTIVKRFGNASVVTAFNAFAHADQLSEITKSIETLLSPSGLFVFEVSYLLDIIDRKLLGTVFHEHMSYHSLKPLVRFLDRHELTLIDVKRNTMQGGSLIGIAQRKNGPYSVLPSVDDILKIEEARKLDQPQTLKAFAQDLQALKNELMDIIASLKKEKKSIAGFGAARSGTTLISQMNLGKVIEFIVDDSAEKQYKFSPGDHIPVYPTQELYQRKPDYVFILAWIHSKKIIENHQAFLKQGGRFITCFPKIQIIETEVL